MNKNAKTIIALEAILVGILTASIIFLVVTYEIPVSDNETTCGEGTIEIDGICYGDIEIKQLLKRIKSLEAELVEMNIEYEWLSEVANRLAVLHNETTGFKLPDHLLNTDYSIEKCEELLDIGFYAYTSNNSAVKEAEMYGTCIEIAQSLND